MAGMSVLLLFASLSASVSLADNRIDTFYRCIADTPLPPFNTSKPACVLPMSEFEEVYQDRPKDCRDIQHLSDLILQQNIDLRSIQSLKLNDSTPIDDLAWYCMVYMYEHLCYEHDICDTNPVDEAMVFMEEACEMEFFSVLSNTSNGIFNYKMYRYLSALMMWWSRLDYLFQIPRPTATIQHFLYTCKTIGNDIDDCVKDLVDLSYILDASNEFDEDFYYFVSNRLCHQFGGDQKYQCLVVLDLQTFYILEDFCSLSVNEEECEVKLNNLLNKTITQINSSDVDQIKAILNGGSHRLNYTNETLHQLNEVIDYFSIDLNAVSEVIDRQDMTAFLSVVNTLASEERANILSNETNQNNSGAVLLHDIDQLSALLGFAVINGNEKVGGNYSYNGDNIGLSLFVGMPGKNYSSGELNLNRTNDSSILADMSASISISYTDICFGSLSTNTSCEDYDYDDICNGSATCIIDYNGYSYYYFDLELLFGDCAKGLCLEKSCQSVVVTSVTTNIPQLFSEGVPNNMTLASLILSSRILSIDNTSSNYFTDNLLKENATLHFKLSNPINLTMYSPKCVYWRTTSMEWSDEGLETIILSYDEVECVTNHLTSFAVLVDHRGLLETGSVPKKEAIALSVIGYVGPSISIACLLLAIIFMIYLRLTNKVQTHSLFYIQLNLCIALLLALSLLVTGLETADEIKWLCSVVAGLLHYLFLCVFCWMLAEGIALYIMVTHVWTFRRLKWYLFMPLGWGVPVIIVGISAGLRYDLYGTDNFCWISFEKGMMWAFLGPVLVICMINTVILIIAVVRLTMLLKRKAEHHMKKATNLALAKSGIFGAIVLLPILGVTWIIGIFAVSSKTTLFLWLFTICNSLQGVGILVFRVLRNKEVLIWLRKNCYCLSKYFPDDDSKFTTSSTRLSTRSSVYNQISQKTNSEKIDSSVDSDVTFKQTTV